MNYVLEDVQPVLTLKDVQHVLANAELDQFELQILLSCLENRLKDTKSNDNKESVIEMTTGDYSQVGSIYS